MRVKCVDGGHPKGSIGSHEGGPHEVLHFDHMDPLHVPLVRVVLLEHVGAADFKQPTEVVAAHHALELHVGQVLYHGEGAVVVRAEKVNNLIQAAAFGEHSHLWHQV